MSTRRFLSAALLAGALPVVAAAQDLTLIPDFRLYDLDESAVATAYGSQYLVGAARWSAVGGFSAYPGAAIVIQAAHGGSVLMGWKHINGAQHAMRRTASTGWVALPQPAGTAGDFLNPTDMSNDGNVIAGFARLDPSDEYIGWRWTPAGGTTLLDGPATLNSKAYCVAGDGSWVGGVRRLQDLSSRRAVRWNALGKPFWVIPLDFPGPGHPSALTVLNHDGSQGAGHFGIDAFLWQDGVGVTLLPRPANSDGLGLWPTAMTDDGSLVVGYVPDFGETAPSWFWTPGLGTRWISDVAAQLGLDPGDTALPFAVARDCDAAGLRLAGYQEDASGDDVGWILELPAGGVGAVIDLKKSLAGNTTPELEAFGSFVGGSDVTLKLRELLKLTGTHLVIGLSSLGLPFKGGIMIPNPDIVVSFLAPTSKLDIPLPWPTGVPALTSLYFQVWQPQPAGPAGWAASNALQVITP